MLAAQLAIRGDVVHTMAGPAIRDGVILVRAGKIERVGPASQVGVPTGFSTLNAAVVTPGLIDARSVVGLGGYLNQSQDQDQKENSAPIQPELRAIDAYNPRERLVDYLRGYGVTTIHTGHGPGAVISGQTMIVKTRANSADGAVVVAEAMVAATLGDGAKAEGKSPGTRAKAVALFRTELIKAREYAANTKADKSRDLRLEALGRVLSRERPLLVTADRAHDILTALRLAKEFNFRLVLDHASEIHQVLEPVKAAGVQVILHPTMQRSGGDTENQSMETAAMLSKAGIPFALQSGFESYVPKTRVVLFEAAVAAANGLGFDGALGSITIAAARLLGIADRVGSIEPGKDADFALFDGDPFEYTSHATGTVIDGEVVSRTAQ
jgi:imidazolonepropionase-like amidohydrolase